MQEFFVTAFIFCVSFTAVSSIQCYHCLPVATGNCSSFTSEECSRHQTVLLCPKGMNACMQSRLKGTHRGVKIDVERRSCATTKTCGSLKEVCGHYSTFTGVKCDWSCCDKQLCNACASSVTCLVLLLLLCSLLTYSFAGT